MQNRYVADVGDFGKYGLLRALCGVCPAEEPLLSIGIVWYLTEPAGGERVRNDGKHIGYLTARKRALYEPCDPELYGKLREIIGEPEGREARRSIRTIRASGMLPANAKFFEGILQPGGGSERGKWVDRALQEAEGCDLVFLDPDNGFAWCAESQSPKHVLVKEAELYLSRKQSLVVYHHNGRSKAVDEQMREALRVIRDVKLKLACGPFALRYRRGSSRTFFVLPCSEEHRTILWRRASCLAEGLWGRNKHFDPPVDRLM